MIGLLIFVLMYIIIGLIIFLTMGRWGVDDTLSKWQMLKLDILQILLWFPYIIIFWFFLDHFNNNKKDQ